MPALLGRDLYLVVSLLNCHVQGIAFLRVFCLDLEEFCLGLLPLLRYFVPRPAFITEKASSSPLDIQHVRDVGELCSHHTQIENRPCEGHVGVRHSDLVRQVGRLDRDLEVGLPFEGLVYLA